MDVNAWLTEARRRLGPVSETPGLDAQTLLAHRLGVSRAWLLSHPEAGIDQESELWLREALSRLEQGFPLPYLLGHWDFFGLDFIVTPDVLIPRPETELLVEKALARLKCLPAGTRVVDVGTGSGCIAVALAKHAEHALVCAVDRSRAALRVAALNAGRHSAAVRLFQGDLLAASGASFPLVCANLPYIPTSTLQNLPVARFEPHLALNGGPDGLDDVRRLLNDAPRVLAPAGTMLLEIESGQGRAAVEAARAALPQARITLHQDLSGLDRLLEIEDHR